MTEIASLFSFIEASPTAPQAAEEVVRRLTAAGYHELREDADWQMAGGSGYYVRRGSSAVVAFKTNLEPPVSGFMIVASHGDSPTFAVTPAGTMTVGDYLRLTVEKYGGMLCATWLDRPLSIAGVIGVREEDGSISMRSVVVDRDLVVIPSVAIHMNRSANDKASYNPAIDMQPLFGTAGSHVTVDDLLAEAACVRADDIVSRQVWLYVRQKPTIFGAEREFIGSARLDDLECVSASLDAFIASQNRGNAVPVFVLFDHEEIGSATMTGADSDFLKSTLERILTHAGATPAQRAMAYTNTLLVSADNAHAKHPNHPEYADPNHAPKLNGGVVIKHNANRRYATDALSEALFCEICHRVGVPTQNYTNRPDVAGGSTLGSISTTQISVPCVDIGLAQLAMHSAYETAGARDYMYMVKALTEFYTAAIMHMGNGSYRLQS